MRVLIVLMSLLCLGACGVWAAEGGPSSGGLRFDFEGAQALQGWSIDQPGSVRLVPGYRGSQALEVERPVSPTAGTSGADRPLPVSALRGCVVHVQAMLRATSVSVPTEDYNGIKVMLHVASPSGDSWPEYNSWGSFDWKAVDFTAAIPADATAVNLVLGLQDATGKADFDDVRITVVQKPRGRPKHLPAGRVYTGHTVPRLRGTMITPDVRADDLKTLGLEWGANHARWQLTWDGFPHSPADNGDLKAYNVWLEGRLQHLDAMLPVLKRDGLQVLIDLHTPPGGRDDQSRCRIFQEKRFQEGFLQIWDKIARRYKGDAQIWGYDLCNEPVTGGTPDGLLNWHALATAAARRVRAIDPDHAIVVEPDPWADPASLTYFTPIAVPGIVYSIHMYNPHEFTHQGVYGSPTGVHYPGLIGGVLWDKKRLRTVLQPAVDYAQDYNVKIYIGEFSAIRWAPGHDAEHYLSDCIDIFEENGWDWDYHAFREWDGWSVEHGPDPNDHVPAKQPTDRELLLRSWFAKNKKPAWFKASPGKP